jgi:hypothetical protein
MALFGVDPASDRLQLRALRASPPGLARPAGERKNVLAAALGQFDELLTAAEAVGPASAPLLLYYALNQAGRAVAAAREADPELWRPRSHGLKVSDPPASIEDTLITPEKAPQGKRPRDMFRVISDVVGSSHLTSDVTLGALWAAAPGTERVRRLGLANPRAAALGASAGTPTVMVHYTGPEIAKLPKGGRSQALQVRLEAAYPLTRGGMEVSVGISPGPSGSPEFGAELYRRLPSGAFMAADEFAPRFPSGGAHHLIPGLGANEDVLLPLMVWWALLYALSHLARYQPEAWVKALDPTRSTLSAPIEAGLAYITALLPRLVLDELTRY